MGACPYTGTQPPATDQRQYALQMPYLAVSVFQFTAIPDKAETGQYWSRKFIKKLEDMDCGGSAELKAALQIKLQDHLHKHQLLLQSTRAIRSMYRQPAYWPQMQLILSIPGIGEIIAAVILFEL